MKPKKAKKVSYELILRDSEAGKRMYPLLEQLIAKHHDDLVDARIALAWNTGWTPDVDGRWILGKCKKASDLDRELAAFDFVILLNRIFWENADVSDHQRAALLDHECYHAAVKYDERGERVIDERGRVVYRTRKHDLEEFAAIAERYGCWKRDLEQFAGALARAHQRSGISIGFHRLQQRLLAAGFNLTIETIVFWTDAERRAAQEWLNLQDEFRQQKLSGSFTLPNPPAHVTAAAAVGASTSH